MTYTILCTSCDSEVRFDIEGEDIKGSWDEPAEYAYAVIVGRDCDLTGEDACDATDEQLADYAMEFARNARD